MPSSPLLTLQQQYELLQMEYNYEKELFMQQTDRMGLDKKVRKGICWYPLSIGKSYYNSLNQLVVEVSRTDHLDEEHHFEFGRPVVFFDLDMEEGTSGVTGSRSFVPVAICRTSGHSAKLRRKCIQTDVRLPAGGYERL